MIPNFNIDQVLEMAVEVETNGEKFYKKAAQAVAEKNIKDILNDLASKEAVHKETFVSLRKGLSKGDKTDKTFDPEEITDLYLREMADSHVFVSLTDKGIEDLFKKNRTTMDILKVALGFEKESILFFIGMKEFIPSEQGKDKIDLLVEEEMRHVRAIKKVMMELSKSN